MKKKVLASMLAFVLVGSLLAGCGDADNTKESESKTEESKESDEESKEESAEESKEDDSKESKEESTEESTEESVAESSVASDNTDWSTAYDNYFESNPMDGENVAFTAAMDSDGIKADVYIAKYENEIAMKMYAEANGGKNGFEFYVMDDGYIYLKLAVGGEGEQWVKTAQTEETDMSSMTESFTGLTEEVEEVTYVKEVKEDGKTYDVISGAADYQEVQYYVNRDTQKIEKVVTGEGAEEVVIYVTEAEKISLDAEAVSAEEVDGDTFSMALFAGLLGMMTDDTSDYDFSDDSDSDIEWEEYDFEDAE